MNSSALLGLGNNAAPAALVAIMPALRRNSSRLADGALSTSVLRESSDDGGVAEGLVAVADGRTKACGIH